MGIPKVKGLGGGLGSTVFIFELLISAVYLGMWQGSWEVFFGSLVAIFFVVHSAIFVILFSIAMCALWAWLWWNIGAMAFDSLFIQTIFAIAAFALSTLLHFLAVEFEEVGDPIHE